MASYTGCGTLGGGNVERYKTKKVEFAKTIFITIFSAVYANKFQELCRPNEWPASVYAHHEFGSSITFPIVKVSFR